MKRKQLTVTACVVNREHFWLRTDGSITTFRAHYTVKACLLKRSFPFTVNTACFLLGEQLKAMWKIPKNTSRTLPQYWLDLKLDVSEISPDFSFVCFLLSHEWLHVPPLWVSLLGIFFLLCSADMSPIWRLMTSLLSQIHSASTTEERDAARCPPHRSNMQIPPVGEQIVLRESPTGQTQPKPIYIVFSSKTRTCNTQKQATWLAAFLRHSILLFETAERSGVLTPSSCPPHQNKTVAL